MNSSKTLIISLLCIFLLSSALTEAKISCSVVTKDLRPCISYLVSGSGKPPTTCCQGVSALAAAATTTVDKKAACECIKTASKNINVKAGLAQALASNCGVSSPVTISPRADCSTIG